MNATRWWLAVCLLTLAGGCGGEPAFVRQMEKAALVESLRADLLESVEAEKSAVMATTDETSATFADESRRRTTEMERARDALHRRVLADGRETELEKLAAFDAAWAELRDVDRRLLALAVMNSNLKAARLAAGESAAAVNRLADAMAERQSQTGDPATLRRLSGAAVAALRIQSLLAPHIASADDAEMTRLEGEIRTLGGTVRAMLPEAGPEAASAWADYEGRVAEVLRLSRLNTNVVSVDVSLNEKRRATDACRQALADLLSAVRAGPEPTR